MFRDTRMPRHLYDASSLSFMAAQLVESGAYHDLKFFLHSGL
jgi:hypothetical protein